MKLGREGKLGGSKGEGESRKEDKMQQGGYEGMEAGGKSLRQGEKYGGYELEETRLGAKDYRGWGEGR